MAKIILANYPSSMDKFREIHQKSIGGSSVAAVAELHPFKTRFTLWSQFCGFTPWEEENKAMRLGTKLEPIVASEFELEKGLTLRKNDDVFAHDELPWAIATPDYFITDDLSGMVEIKTTSAFGGKFWENDQLPDFAHCQVQWTMGILKIDYAWVVCLAGGRELYTKRVEFDKVIFNQLLELAKTFMSLVDQRVPPQVSAADNKALTNLYPPTGPDVVLDHAADILAEQFLEAKKEASEKQEIADKAQEKAEGLKASLRMMMQNASRATTPSGYTINNTLVHYKEKVVKAYDSIRFSIRRAQA